MLISYPLALMNKFRVADYGVRTCSLAVFAFGPTDVRAKFGLIGF
jgi:hypothetical protein